MIVLILSLDPCEKVAYDTGMFGSTLQLSELFIHTELSTKVGSALAYSRVPTGVTRVPTLSFGGGYVLRVWRLLGVRISGF